MPNMTLPPPLYTTLTQADMSHQEFPPHNAPALSIIKCVPDFFFTFLFFAVPFMALPHMPLMGIKRFDHETKVKARSERQNLQATSQLCTNK